MLSFCLETDIGDVYVWGWNERGQLGLPSKLVQEERRKTQSSNQEMDSLQEEDFVNILLHPQVIDLMPQLDDICVVKIACGSRHSAALTGSVDTVSSPHRYWILVLLFSPTGTVEY